MDKQNKPTYAELMRQLNWGVESPSSDDKEQFFAGEASAPEEFKPDMKDFEQLREMFSGRNRMP